MTKIFSNKTQDGSYIHNCIIKRRLDDIADALFAVAPDDSKMIVKIYGYAIIPREEYESLSKLTSYYRDGIR